MTEHDSSEQVHAEVEMCLGKAESDLTKIERAAGELDAELDVDEEATRAEKERVEALRARGRTETNNIGARVKAVDAKASWPRFLLTILWFFVSAAVLLSLGSASLVTLGNHLGSFYSWVARDDLALLVVAAVFGLGGVQLHRWRKSHRKHYGAFEVGTAVATLAFLLSHPQSDPVRQTAAIIATLYFFVRGFDNLESGARDEFSAIEKELADRKEAVRGLRADLAAVDAIAAEADSILEAQRQRRDAINRRLAALKAAMHDVKEQIRGLPSPMAGADDVPPPVTALDVG